jgi:hypothetical protein
MKTGVAAIPEPTDRTLKSRVAMKKHANRWYMVESPLMVKWYITGFIGPGKGNMLRQSHVKYIEIQVSGSRGRGNVQRIF